jgi:PiT family inorganic phosphate transporter
MTSVAQSQVSAKLAQAPSRLGMLGFFVVLAVGIGFVLSRLVSDLSDAAPMSLVPYIGLGAALLIALAFEFVNGFHDTANAVATVIYTNSLDPHIAVMWSGSWNFIGVLISSGAVAFGIISLLPVELILQVGSAAGFAMVFALLTAAIIWNLGTWYLGLPSSSSHTLVGSIIGVGIANQMMSTVGATSGVDWAQAGTVGKSLLLSPLIGFALAGSLLMVMKAVIPDKRLYEAPKGTEPPPFWIRCLLILTCTGVSFFHGSNDGQKGMGLIMLILVGIVPSTYALNRAVPASHTVQFVAISSQAEEVLKRYAAPGATVGEPREDVSEFVRTRKFKPYTALALSQVVNGVANELSIYKEMKNVPAGHVHNFRNDMFLVSEALRIMKKTSTPVIAANDWTILDAYKKETDNATKYIPIWVKVAVALALGLGTMVGWKRIVVTVGEKIGKDHLTYAQGAAAEITAMATIGAADMLGLPVSTTHVLSSGVAGTMVANKSGLQWATVRSLLMAWVLTLPVSIMLSGFLFWAFRSMAG